MYCIEEDHSIHVRHYRKRFSVLQNSLPKVHCSCADKLKKKKKTWYILKENWKKKEKKS